MTQAVYFLSEEDVHKGAEPAFYRKENFTWVKTLEDNWRIIRDEMLEVIEGNKPINLTSSNPLRLSDPSAWKNHENCKKYPKTYSLLKSIPNFTFTEFTVLEPDSKILPHIGETNTTIRGQLGIDIPYPHPHVGICVENEERGWENGKVVLFRDSHIHHVQHYSIFKIFSKPAINFFHRLFSVIWYVYLPIQRAMPFL